MLERAATTTSVVRTRRHAAAVTGLLFGLYLIFWDPRTRRLFRKTHGNVVERPVI